MLGLSSDMNQNHVTQLACAKKLSESALYGAKCGSALVSYHKQCCFTLTLNSVLLSTRLMLLGFML